jgi:hypothetical protein
MTNQEIVSKESQSPRRKKVFLLIAVVAAGFALCTAIKPFVCGKSGGSCPCQAAFDQTDNGCSSSQEE